MKIGVGWGMELKVMSIFCAGGITFGLDLIKQLFEKIFNRR